MVLITFTVTCELEKTSGKFISGEDLAEEILGELTDPGSVEVEDSEYEVTGWDVEYTIGKPKTAKGGRR